MKLISLIIFNLAWVIGLSADHITESFATCPASDTIYVDQAATGDNDGTTWCNAFTNLQAAIDFQSSCSNRQIWVAEGTYVPTTANSISTSNDARDTTFLIEDPVKIYGGFTSGATSLSERDSISGNTILTGTLTGGDTAYHVIFIRADSITSDYEINGFTIKDGKADGSSVDGNGGGLHMSTTGVIAARIANNIFENNRGKDGGGIFANANSKSVSPTIINCSFINNKASSRGGGLYMNTTLNADPKLVNCVFSNNNAVNAGGGVRVNGGSENTSSFINCSFSNNDSSSGNGGGIQLSGNDSNPLISNCIFWDNTAFEQGSDVNQVNAGGGTISHSILQSGGANNITTFMDTLNQDPLFVNATDHNLRLKSDSPAINMGVNTFVPTGITTDIDGNNRIRYGTIDIGAYEGVPCLNADILYVDSSNTNPGDGTSWTTSVKDLQEAINISNVCEGGKQIWVANGTYRPTQILDVDFNSVLEIREKTFFINSPVMIYGGFEGGEDEIGARDINKNKTILTGDLGNGLDTAYHVITIRDGQIGVDFRLDGLVIRDGRANGIDFSLKNGGGIYMRAFAFRGNSPSISIKIINCSIHNNFASSSGAGIYSSASLSDGSSSAQPEVINCLIYNNVAESKGGGIYNYGGVTRLKVSNSTIYNNTAGIEGGGIYNMGDGHGTTSDPTITNSIIWLNSAQEGGTDIYKNNSLPDRPNGTISHSILTSPFSIEGRITYMDTMVHDPMFMNTASGSEDLRLIFGSPAIDAGLNQAIASTTDINGKPRLLGHDVDMGAYEYGDNQDCDQTVFLHPQEFVNATEIYNTDQTIFATNKITSTDITYDALLGVELGLQFEVSNGAMFQAKMDGCN